MDVTSITTNVSSHVIDKLFHDTSTSVLNNHLSSTLKNLLRNASDSKSDALQSVKLDPAVLEAHVTVDATDTKMSASCTDQKEDNPSTDKNILGSSHGSFKDVVMAQESALLSLTPEQYDILLKYTDTLRGQRNNIQKITGCAFCKNNGEALSWYSNHILKDTRGRVRCPVLRALHCPRCGATGDRAHTIKYCPGNYDSGHSSHCSSIK